MSVTICWDWAHDCVEFWLNARYLLWIIFFCRDRSCSASWVSHPRVLIAQPLLIDCDRYQRVSIFAGCFRSLFMDPLPAFRASCWLRHLFPFKEPLLSLVKKKVTSHCLHFTFMSYSGPSATASVCCCDATSSVSTSSIRIWIWCRREKIRPFRFLAIEKKRKKEKGKKEKRKRKKKYAHFG